MLFDRARHEPLQDIEWDEDRARAFIAHVVADAEAHCVPGQGWPAHPQDIQPGEPNGPLPTLYDGGAGMAWGLHYLQDLGAVSLSRSYLDDPATLLAALRRWMGTEAQPQAASYLMGQTPIELLAYGVDPQPARAERLAELISGNLDHPSRELMWGAPGTMLAALFLFERTGHVRWAELFRASAARLWSQLQDSAEFQCRYWTQDLQGRPSTYLDAVHGFVATALPLIRGRRLLAPGAWEAWQACIANTVQRTATWEEAQANWRPWLTPVSDQPLLMQFCHGAPGFVVCLADFPGDALDPLLLAAGQAIWTAGPLRKGANLCHGTGGNGYAFLKLYRRTGRERWLHRARAFAMHGIAQIEAQALAHARMRYSLWTGDLGFAIYLWDCLRGGAAFPTLDVFYGRPL
jgi:hypothetical protein